MTHLCRKQRASKRAELVCLLLKLIIANSSFRSLGGQELLPAAGQSQLKGARFARKLTLSLLSYARSLLQTPVVPHTLL